jgi:DNA-binding transcriptional ArsR family regulator
VILKKKDNRGIIFYMTMNYRSLERRVKGFANHNRLKILDLLRQKPELSVDDIADKLKIGY